MQDSQYAADFDRLLDLCREHGVAVQTIKGVCRGPWGSKEPTAATWYEPLEEQDDIDLAVHWSWGRPTSFSTAWETSGCCRNLTRPNASRRARATSEWPACSKIAGSLPVRLTRRFTLSNRRRDCRSRQPACLSRAQLLESLDRDDLERVAATMSELEFEAGSVITREGERGDRIARGTFAEGGEGEGG